MNERMNSYNYILLNRLAKDYEFMNLKIRHRCFITLSMLIPVCDDVNLFLNQ